MSFTTWLNITCNLERFNPGVLDSYNRPTGTWDSLAANAKCRIQKSKGKEFKVKSEMRLSTHTLFLQTQDVTEKDRVVISTVVYNILSVEDAAGHVHHLELELELVEA
ncbi:hypothetical protein LCGC14_0630260 [marine sediment metagenome]|uniref:Phage head-tail adaptor n=1 Tax=marine sediment metagenome TaxID=412755 RepID=A0A0F9RLL9_9ZZZZ